MEYFVLVIDPELKIVEEQLNSAESVTEAFEARAKVLGAIERDKREHPLHWTDRLNAELEAARP